MLSASICRPPPHINDPYHTCMNESCHIYIWVMLHVWMSYVTYTFKSCHIYSWHQFWCYPLASTALHPKSTSHITNMDESHYVFERAMWYIYEWATSRTWMSRVTHTNESCHVYEWALSHTWMTSIQCYPLASADLHPIWLSHITCMHDSCLIYV